ncbi:hypothetical protein DUNSADRAFT_822 [Dunaliella salina]|uniref:Uncharacterized protein n=1 Tax=Dunaliella salina TaxID=3046 RepID=A0ABQ7GXT2_DUNSA|nr:hypothetical protein DUNSADRAFT_822 [Dunaliella salina]|eukprot:KAF5839421.1 hypothetical protein DUNSADRAFT_822 [Dunaliella salina]
MRSAVCSNSVVQAGWGSACRSACTHEGSCVFEQCCAVWST